VLVQITLGGSSHRTGSDDQLQARRKNPNLCRIYELRERSEMPIPAGRLLLTQRGKDGGR
jgi:hypothetical protein